MSEYQYYEFQTIDKPLTENQQAAISQLSSRVQLSSTRAVFTYSYGDFRGNPEEVLANYFDAMFYIANWGTKQLMFRFPKLLIDFERIEDYCIEDYITLSVINDYAILNIQTYEEGGYGWIETGEGYLQSLVELRNDILQRDYRLLYLAWLKAITLQEEVDEEEYEPPIPSGLNELTSSLNNFVELFEVDENLLKVAAQLSDELQPLLEESLMEAINILPLDECNNFLLRLAKGEPNLTVELNQRLFELIDIPQNESQPQRTIQELLEAAEEEIQQETIKQQQQEDEKRIQELKKLAQREGDAWEEIDKLVEKKQAKAYDEAVQLLLKLQDLAVYQDKTPAFQERVNAIYERYSNRPSLLKRLQGVGLNPG
jgi:hypothetical protein